MKHIFSISLIFCIVLTALAQETVSEDQLYFTVSASRTRVFEQEAVLLTYRFHAYGSMGLSVGMNSKPDFQGLVSQEIPQPENKPVYTETVNGRVQRTGVVKQSLVFPQRAGRITVPGLTFNCEVRVGEGMLGAAMKLKRRVPDLILEVDPLPQPAPAAFRGAVGQFDVKNILNASHTKTGDLVSRLLTISGKGNLRLITPPSLTFPDGFDVFDPTVDDNVRVSAEGMSGSVTFGYPFMSRVAGDYTLPADTFCYFDPQAREYRSIVLSAISIKVAQGERSREEMEAEAELRHSDIRPDHTFRGVSRTEGWGIWLWMVCVAVLLALCVAADRMLLRRTRNQTMKKGVAGAGGRADKGLREAAFLLERDNRSGALAVLEKTLVHFAAEYVPSVTSVDRGAMASALLAKGFDATPVKDWQSVLAAIDEARFAPQSADGESERALLQRAANVLQRLNPKQ